MDNLRSTLGTKKTERSQTHTYTFAPHRQLITWATQLVFVINTADLTLNGNQSIN
jgi:hypothetical protein